MDAAVQGEIPPVPRYARGVLPVNWITCEPTALLNAVAAIIRRTPMTKVGVAKTRNEL